MANIETRSDRPSTDRRVQRTRAAILDAFVHLILSQGYDAVTPTTLAAAANVGRSTFYEHFANVDEVLAFSISGLLTPLAEAVMQPHPSPAMTHILQHFWDNRKVARGMFAGGGHRVMQRLFSEHFEAALAELRCGLGVTTPVVAPRLAAAHLAAGSLAVLGAWLTGQASGSATEIAAALHVAGHASALAMSAGAPITFA